MHAMTGFADARAPEPTIEHWDVASDAMSRLGRGEDPVNRMEAGLRLAMELGTDPKGVPEIEARRFEMAFAHAVARNHEMEEGGPALASTDWARSFLVDASIQREAEATLGATSAARASRHRWGASETKNEHWAVAGVPPTLFSNASEDELKVMASGRMHELTGDRATQIEIAVMSAMAPGSPRLEHDLEIMTVGSVAVSGMRGMVEHADRSAFGPPPIGPDNMAMAGIADRMDLARRAAEVGHRDARGLFDPTPGRNPFVTDFDQERRSERAVMGLDATPFGRIVNTAAHSLNALSGFDVDMDGAHRLKMAAARLLATGPNAFGDEKGDIRALMADVLLQRAAEEKLSGRDRGSAGLLEEMISGNRDSRESVRFTTLPSERRETEAVANGRFSEVGDGRGIASGLRNATWRASIVGSPEIDRTIRQEMVALRPTGKAVSAAKGRVVPESPAVAMAIAARGGASR
jgi:hypothetical protein